MLLLAKYGTGEGIDNFHKRRAAPLRPRVASGEKSTS